jgi:hypothetical protein
MQIDDKKENFRIYFTYSNDKNENKNGDCIISITFLPPSVFLTHLVSINLNEN